MEQVGGMRTWWCVLVMAGFACILFDVQAGQHYSHLSDVSRIEPFTGCSTSALKDGLHNKSKPASPLLVRLLKRKASSRACSSDDEGDPSQNPSQDPSQDQVEEKSIEIKCEDCQKILTIYYPPKPVKPGLSRTRSFPSLMCQNCRIQQSWPYHDPDQKLLPPYDVKTGSAVGKGNFATVQSMRFPYGKNPNVVRKRLSRSTSLETDYKVSENEYAIMKRLSSCPHINIIHCQGAYYDNQQLFLVFEKGGINLKEMIERAAGSLSDSLTQHVLKAVLQGLVFLGQQGITHRDIKPDNILIRSNGRVQICDLGIAYDLDGGRDPITNIPLWITPPEVVAAPPTLSPINDIWGVGCLWYQMASGYQLFHSKSYEMMLREGNYLKIQATIAKGKDIVRQKYGDRAADLFQNMMKIHPENRITAEKSLEHCYITAATGDVFSSLQVTHDDSLSTVGNEDSNTTSRRYINANLIPVEAYLEPVSGGGESDPDAAVFFDDLSEYYQRPLPGAPAPAPPGRELPLGACDNPEYQAFRHSGDNPAYFDLETLVNFSFNIPSIENCN